jgi:MoxR-like ATPase
VPDRIDDATPLTLDTLSQLQQETARVRVDRRIQSYLIELCEATRKHESIALGVSPRGMLLWQRVAQAWAKLAGRDFVIPADIQAVAVPVLTVRLVARVKNSGVVVNSILSSIAVPSYQ